jgi:hypothetical protein
MVNVRYDLEGIANGILLSGTNIWGKLYFKTIEEALAHIKYEQNNHGLVANSSSGTVVLTGDAVNGKV